MTRGQLIRQKHVTRQMLRDNRDTLYIFGDNMARAGFGGQAKEMRGEVNAVGVPTKMRPKRTEKAYFTDAHLDRQDVIIALRLAFDRLEQHLRSGRNVVIPADGLGTGLAELPTRAPRIHREIEARVAGLERVAEGRGDA
jgi:hypothetical protein